MSSAYYCPYSVSSRTSVQYFANSTFCFSLPQINILLLFLGVHFSIDKSIPLLYAFFYITFLFIAFVVEEKQQLATALIVL